MRDLRQRLHFDRWTEDTRQVIPYQYSYDDFDVELLAKYKSPGVTGGVVTQDSIRPLNAHNYVHKMHRLLELEEVTRRKLISRYKQSKMLFCY